MTDSRKALRDAIHARDKVAARIGEVERLRDGPASDVRRLLAELSPLKQQLADLQASEAASSEFQRVVADLEGRTDGTEALERQIEDIEKRLARRMGQCRAIDEEIARIKAVDLARADWAVQEAIDGVLSVDACTMFDEMAEAWAVLRRNYDALSGMGMLSLRPDLQIFPMGWHSDAWWAQIEVDETVSDRHAAHRAALKTDPDAKLPPPTPAAVAEAA
jgi:hypothetical protein